MLVAAFMTTIMVIVSVQAKLNGDEKQDVALKGTVGGPCGLVTAATAII